MPQVEIDYLDWNDDNEDHIRRHVDPHDVQELFESRNWILARNKRNQPGQRLRMIGQTIGGAYLTVIVSPTSDDRIWRPVTAYLSEWREIHLFERTKRRSR